MKRGWPSCAQATTQRSSHFLHFPSPLFPFLLFPHISPHCCRENHLVALLPLLLSHVQHQYSPHEGTNLNLGGSLGVGIPLLTLIMLRKRVEAKNWRRGGGGGGLHAGQQTAPHMHILVCICRNVWQFQHISTPQPADLYLYNWQTFGPPTFRCLL